jgi:parallel beta-helix repeat protein
MRRLIPSLAALFCTAALAHSATWYVSPSGSDSNPCTKDAPCQTIDRGVQALRSGDTLYLQGGTYTYQSIGDHGPTPVPSGSSWETATTIAAAPGETVWLKVTSISLSGTSYVIFDRLHVDNGSFSIDGASHHVRWQNGEFTNTESAGANMFIGGSGHHLEVLNTDIHDAGGGGGKGCTDPYGCYGMYWSGSDSLFDNNRVYNNGGYGWHIFSSGHDNVANNVVSNSLFYGNGFTDLRGHSGCAFILSCGPGNKAYNNVIYENACGIQIDYRCHNCEVYNNTIYGNQGYGIAIAGSNSVAVKNNILYKNSSGIIDNVGDATLDHNWLDDGRDPGFVSEGSRDFHLREGSLAIDAGVNVGLPYAGTAPDLGAYEFGANTGPGTAGAPGGTLAPVASAPPAQPRPTRLRLMEP